jgi:hypothetical protein
MDAVGDHDAAALVEELTRKLYRSRAEQPSSHVAYAESQTSSDGTDGRRTASPSRVRRGAPSSQPQGSPPTHGGGRSSSPAPGSSSSASRADTASARPSGGGGGGSSSGGLSRSGSGGGSGGASCSCAAAAADGTRESTPPPPRDGVGGSGGGGGGGGGGGHQRPSRRASAENNESGRSLTSRNNDSLPSLCSSSTLVSDPGAPGWSAGGSGYGYSGGSYAGVMERAAAGGIGTPPRRLSHRHSVGSDMRRTDSLPSNNDSSRSLRLSRKARATATVAQTPPTSARL